jgi:hypothetical protein
MPHFPGFVFDWAGANVQAGGNIVVPDLARQGDDKMGNFLDLAGD